MSFIDNFASWAIRPNADAFWYAAATGDTETVKKYLKNKGDPTVHQISLKTFYKVFPKINHQTIRGPTRPVDIDALKIACMMGKSEIVDILLRDERVVKCL